MIVLESASPMSLDETTYFLLCAVSPAVLSWINILTLLFIIMYYVFDCIYCVTNFSLHRDSKEKLGRRETLWVAVSLLLKPMAWPHAEVSTMTAIAIGIGQWSIDLTCSFSFSHLSGGSWCRRLGWGERREGEWLFHDEMGEKMHHIFIFLKRNDWI